MARADYWNHNVHYQPVILGAVPPGCGPALDVGCGDGLLACRLTDRCAQVTGLDRDPRMIALARARVGARARVHFIEADFLAYDFPAASFDFVCANTSLHHMDFAAALTKLARVLRPGAGSRSSAWPRTGPSPISSPPRPPSRRTCSTGPCTARASPVRPSWIPR